MPAGHEAVELPPAGDQPTPELDFGLDDESLLDYSDEHDSDEEDMQLSLDARPRRNLSPRHITAPAPGTLPGCAESSQLPRAPSPSPSQCAVLAAGRGVLCWLRRV